MIGKTSTKEFKFLKNELENRNYFSKFSPLKIINYLPLDFEIYTFNSGFKKKTEDLLLIVFKKKNFF